MKKMKKKLTYLQNKPLLAISVLVFLLCALFLGYQRYTALSEKIVKSHNGDKDVIRYSY